MAAAITDVLLNSRLLLDHVDLLLFFLFSSFLEELKKSSFRLDLCPLI